MSEFLGRPLYPGEEVHHKNRIRDDNRLSNLELWSHSQPPGGRVPDLLVYARELQDRYMTDEDAENYAYELLNRRKKRAV